MSEHLLDIGFFFGVITVFLLPMFLWINKLMVDAEGPKTTWGQYHWNGLEHSYPEVKLPELNGSVESMLPTKMPMGHLTNGF
jgi:hypothetical protein